MTATADESVAARADATPSQVAAARLLLTIARRRGERPPQWLERLAEGRIVRVEQGGKARLVKQVEQRWPTAVAPLWAPG